MSSHAVLIESGNQGMRSVYYSPEMSTPASLLKEAARALIHSYKKKDKKNRLKCSYKLGPKCRWNQRNLTDDGWQACSSLTIIKDDVEIDRLTCIPTW